jgi:Tfp pilus assembly protein PilF/predicted Ser/Thr protein kinase
LAPDVVEQEGASQGEFATALANARALEAKNKPGGGGSGPFAGISDMVGRTQKKILDGVIAVQSGMPGADKKLTPEQAQVLTQELTAVERLVTEGKPAEAEQKVDEVIKLDPGNLPARELRATLRLEQGKNEEALQDILEVLSRDPKNETALDLKAMIESGGRLKGKAIDLKRPAFSGLSGGGEDAPSWVKAGGPSGGEWMWGGTAGSGPARQAEVGAAAPSPGGALLQSAMEKFRVGDLNGAMLDATRALQMDKTDLRARTIRASVANRQKNFEGAVWEAGEILKLDPKSVPARLEKAMAEFGLLQYAAALGDAQAALKLDPSNALALVYLGMILEKMNRKEESLGAYEKAASLDPSMGRLLEDARSRMLDEPAGRGWDWRKVLRWAGPIVLALALVIVGAWWRTSGSGSPAAGAGGDAAVPASTVPGATVLQTSAATLAQGSGPVGPGSLLGGTYRVTRELGRGGMGVVYEAMDEKLQRPVALKQLSRSAYGSPEMRERFLKEARLVAKLRHPHLAEIFAVAGEEDLYLVFELVQGEALDKTLAKRGRLGLEEAKKVVGEVCEALEYAHGERVIHRDLKPSNVMFDGEGRVKVMDFGIAHEARGTADMTKTAAWGTPPYMAPEQEGGRVGRESDLYALAVMSYEMVTGSRPFPGPYFLEKKLKKEYPPATSVNGTLPKSVDAFFAKALEPEPEKRFRTAAEFSAAFKALS